MKFLIDQNISHRVKNHLNSEFEEIFHINDVNLIDTSDNTIFKFARKNAFDAIITMDDDFQNILSDLGMPPKIIWIRTGNCSTKYLANKLNAKFGTIQYFLSQSNFDSLEIF